MPRKVLIATTSFGSPVGATVDSNIELAYTMLDAAGSHRADAVCLPEAFMVSGVPPMGRGGCQEPIPGPLFDGLAARARQHGMYVIAGLVEQRGEGVYNTAVIIDRQGRLVGQYDKVHLTISEVEKPIVPGLEPRVFDLDFGRVGLAICYDIGWPALWERLAELGAEIVAWPSAYDGGFPLQAYAWRHFYYVVSSVRSWHARVIDITGEILTSTNRYQRVVTQQIDLEKMVFHTDQNAARLSEISQRLGRRATVRAFSEENIFTLESNDPGLSAADIAGDFGLESYRAYHARAERLQKQTYNPAE